MRRKITPNCEYHNPQLNLSNQIIREPEPTDSFYTEELIDTQCEGLEKCYAHPDPIYMLFNQERIKQLGVTAGTAFLEQFTKYEGNALNELRKKCTDEQLLTMIKSRHLQQPSEILAWSRYMDANVEEFNSELKAAIEVQKQQQTTDVQPQNVE